MKARNRFPIDREQPRVRYTIDPGVWKDMCDLIDRLTEHSQLANRLGYTIAAALTTDSFPDPDVQARIEAALQ